MEMYIQAGQADRDPYWCEPWPSAIAMSEQLLRRPELVRGKRACELGCGLGLAGLAAAVAGAHAWRGAPHHAAASAACTVVPTVEI